MELEMDNYFEVFTWKQSKWIPPESPISFIGSEVFTLTAKKLDDVTESAEGKFVISYFSGRVHEHTETKTLTVKVEN